MGSSLLGRELQAQNPQLPPPPPPKALPALVSVSELGARTSA